MRPSNNLENKTFSDTYQGDQLECMKVQVHGWNTVRTSYAFDESRFDMAFLRRWVPSPGVLCSKPLGGTKVDSAFHFFEVAKMSTRNFWELSGKK